MHVVQVGGRLSPEGFSSSPYNIFPPLRYLQYISFEKTNIKKIFNSVGDTCKEEIPYWITDHTVLVKSLADDKYNWVRDNMGPDISTVSSRCLRFSFPAKNSYEYQGALCNKGHTSGKHVYAIMWPRDQKYNPDAYLCIGIGYTTLDLKGDYAGPIIGGNRKSLGFCVTHNYLHFDGEIVGKHYPRNKDNNYCSPTLIFMYLDLDEGKLSFGTDGEYWGIAFHFGNLKRNMKRPFHFMLCARGLVGKFMLFYKGHGKSLHNLMTVNFVMLCN